MKPTIKIYLLVFLTFGIPLAFILSLYDITTGFSFNMFKFLFFILFSSIPLTFVFVYFYKKSLSKNGFKEITNEVIKPRHYRTLDSNITKEELVEKLKADPVFSKMNMSSNVKGIFLKSNMSWTSLGEKIHINIHKLDTGGNRYHFSSKPILITRLIDNGKNWANVNRLEQLINT